MTDRREPLSALLDIMARLRDPACGCPWDLAQTFATIAPYTIEEAYEVAEVIESGDLEGDGAAARHDAARLQDELGDLLFQVVFHARLAQERGWFDFRDVARAISEKLIRRHPHVFGAESARIDAAALPRHWEEQKARERADAAQRRGDAGASTLADVPLALPGLLRAAKLGKRAGRVGFDWVRADDVRAKVLEELSELDAAVEGAAPEASAARGAGQPEMGQRGTDQPGAGQGGAAGLPQANAGGIAEELGDLLFAVANWGRHLGVEPETALRAANAKFERRFACMERLARERGLELAALSPAEWDALWRESKLATATA